MSFDIHAELVDYASREITFDQVSARTLRFLGSISQKRLMRELKIGALEMRNEIVLSMRNSPPTGNLYGTGKYRNGTARTWRKQIMHRASAPGNPPRPNTGDLIRSIIMDARPTEIEVGSNILQPAYPKFLEHGTKRMEKRPWLDPAVKKIEPKVKFNIQRILRETSAEFVQ